MDNETQAGYEAVELFGGPWDGKTLWARKGVVRMYVDHEADTKSTVTKLDTMAQYAKGDAEGKMGIYRPREAHDTVWIWRA